jgi:hypothetical protein
MKDTLKMQGVTRPVVGIKKLIDYYNENYTRKKECICKDLRPTRMLDVDEYFNFVNDGNEATPLLEKPYFPLFKTPKIKDNRPVFIGYILKTDGGEYKGNMKQVVRNGHKLNVYSNLYVGIAINGDEVALGAKGISINVNNCSLTLYTDSLELPKLEYPKNKMDMYRALIFIETVCYSINDENLYELLDKISYNIFLPNNIDELDLFLGSSLFCVDFNIRKNAYFINPDKDNYYTILDAIKKGKTIYKDLETPLVNWKINKEEKVIYLGELMATEKGLGLLPN